jgi:CheY-like chemotaxis protein
VHVTADEDLGLLAVPTEEARAGVSSALFHALRNVVTGLRGELELAEETADPTTRALVETLTEDTTRLTRLLRALDALRHFDPGVPHRRMDIGALGEAAATTSSVLLGRRTTVTGPAPGRLIEADVEVRPTRELVVASCWALSELEPATLAVQVAGEPARVAFAASLRSGPSETRAWLDRHLPGLRHGAAQAGVEVSAAVTDQALHLTLTFVRGSAPAHSPPVEDRGEVPPDSTVLIIEDRPDVATFVARTLERAGFTVATAGDCRTAVASGLELDDVVLVVADVMLPDGVGPEAVRRIRERLPTARALYMTGYAQDLDVLVHGGSHDGLLMKPFTGAELVEAVAAACRPAAS